MADADCGQQQLTDGVTGDIYQRNGSNSGNAYDYIYLSVLFRLQKANGA